MKTTFVLTTMEHGNIKEKEIDRAELKTERGIFLHLHSLADKTFGRNNWKAVPCNEGFAGYYASQNETGDCIAATN